jgi:hypothetical protein
MSQGNLAPFIRSALQAGAASWRCKLALPGGACFPLAKFSVLRYYCVLCSPDIFFDRVPNRLWRGAGVAEQGCLLSSYTGKTGVGGSNPPLSARFSPVAYSRGPLLRNPTVKEMDRNPSPYIE